MRSLSLSLSQKRKSHSKDFPSFSPFPFQAKDENHRYEVYSNVQRITRTRKIEIAQKRKTLSGGSELSKPPIERLITPLSCPP